MTNLDRLIVAYIDCALCTESDDNGEPLDRNYYPKDIVPDSLVKMREDCESFYGRAKSKLGLDDGSYERAGADFWLTRNRSGAGFWDGDWPVSGGYLTELAHSFPEVRLVENGHGQLELESV